MTYRIVGLDPADFAHLIGASDAELSRHGAVRVTADAKPGYPCRITLNDADVGETLILINHISHDVAGPFRAAHGIYVRETATAAAHHCDEVPPVFTHRTLSLRGFDDRGMLIDASLAAPGESDAAIRAMLANHAVVTLHVHNAIPGCFAATVIRA